MRCLEEGVRDYPIKNPVHHRWGTPWSLHVLIAGRKDREAANVDMNPEVFAHHTHKQKALRLACTLDMTWVKLTSRVPFFVLFFLLFLCLFSKFRVPIGSCSLRRFGGTCLRRYFPVLSHKVSTPCYVSQFNFFLLDRRLWHPHKPKSQFYWLHQTAWRAFVLERHITPTPMIETASVAAVKARCN